MTFLTESRLSVVLARGARKGMIRASPKAEAAGFGNPGVDDQLGLSTSGSALGKTSFTEARHHCGAKRLPPLCAQRNHLS